MAPCYLEISAHGFLGSLLLLEVLLNMILQLSNLRNTHVRKHPNLTNKSCNWPNLRLLYCLKYGTKAEGICTMHTGGEGLRRKGSAYGPIEGL